MKTTILAGMLLAASTVPSLAAGDHAGGHYSFGEPGKAAEASRTISVTLDEMSIRHDLKQVKRGETIRFVITNRGTMDHELSVGDTASQRAHAAMMKKNPHMKHDDDPTAVTVAPGETKEVVWKFNKAVQGQIELACQMPGHYEAGMTSKVAMSR